MIVLAVDTALDHCQAAVVDVRGDGEARLIADASGRSEGDAEAIVGRGRQVIDAAGGLAAIDRIAVTTGPGSFTGVRVGISYVQGLAFGAQLEVVGLNVLELLALDANRPVVTAVDARHGAVYAALFQEPGLSTAAPARRMEAAEAAALAAASGADIIAYATAADHFEAAVRCDRLDLAALARGAILAGDAGRPLRAAYLAAVDAATQRHKALARQ